MREGTVVLFHGPNFFSRLIRFGQSLRFRGDRKKYSYWNHVAMVIGVDGDEPVIVEAVSTVRSGKLWDLYNSEDYVITYIEPPYSDADRIQAVEFVNRQVGEAYDWLQILSMGIRCVIGGNILFKFTNAHICSGLVGEALERAGYDFGKEASDLMPADIAEFFGV